VLFLPIGTLIGSGEMRVLFFFTQFSTDENTLGQTVVG